MSELVEALFKLLRISASLEILDCSSILTLNPALNNEFFISLGEIKTLRSLDLSFSGKFTDSIFSNFGKALAFNAKKNGAIEFVNFTGTLNSSSNITSLYNNMNISEHDHELWYGDPTKAQKMSGNDFTKVYWNNLKAI